MMGWTEFKKQHRWFCKHSRIYAGVGYGRISFVLPWVKAYGPKYKLKDVLYWPIAYLKFMWLCKNG